MFLGKESTLAAGVKCFIHFLSRTKIVNLSLFSFSSKE